MIELSPERIAAAIGGRIVTSADRGVPFPARAVIDSRESGPGDLFFGLPGEADDGGRHAVGAIAAGAWGAVVAAQWATELAADDRARSGEAWVFEVDQPLAALQRLAREWRRELGATVTGITGSVGKTSTKDILKALLPGAVHASEQNFNTEIGLPLTVLSAEPGTEHLVLEMAMRGAGQIAELAEISEPDLGVITNAGPVHTELLGSVEAVAAAKAELLAGLRDGAIAVVPADAGPLGPEIERHSDRLRLIRFGPGGDVQAISTGILAAEGAGERMITEIETGELPDLGGAPLAPSCRRFEFPFTERHNLLNALAAIGAGLAAGVALAEMSERTAKIGFSQFRGERVALGSGIVLVNDCYNANPVSMRAVLDHLGDSGSGRRIAVLGLMAELGPQERDFHAEIGAHAREAGVDLVIGVGEKARWYAPDELVADPAEAAELLDATMVPGDLILVKGSRSAGLEAVAEQLVALRGAASG